jgi:hypothetical protein
MVQFLRRNHLVLRRAMVAVLVPVDVKSRAEPILPAEIPTTNGPSQRLRTQPREDDVMSLGIIGLERTDSEMPLSDTAPMQRLASRSQPLP